ncbi:hypothetical protein [Shimia aestuarii]|uniref:Histidinol phosphate aminotransferase n=1 Tax=Shimia aestuarii TaxID=254406 RepID=A0A1I4IMI3_9RHOB|nr:hypothetical protein [Shimia aestuarii]SFL55203.1 hypothetical protein SAMN04488042_101654 [Shimia aestuarii]
MSRPIQRVEDYTTTCLVMGFVNLLWIFGVLWVLWGLPAVMVFAAILNAGINRISGRP